MESNNKLKEYNDKLKEYLLLFGSEKCDSIYRRIRYLISVKSDIKCIISHNYAKIKVDSHDCLPLEKTMTL